MAFKLNTKDLAKLASSATKAATTLAKSAASAAVETAGKKIEDIKQNRATAEQAFLDSIPFDNKFYIEANIAESESHDILSILDKDVYTAYDLQGKPAYRMKGKNLRGDWSFYVISLSGKKLGSVRKALFKIDTLFTRNRSGCVVSVAGKDSFNIDRGTYFGSIEYSVSSAALTIEQTKNKEFVVRRNDNVIFKAFKRVRGFHYRIYVGVDKKEDIPLALCATFGLLII